MTREPDVIKSLVGVHVLLVDGDVDARELLTSVLTYCGAFVSCASEAHEAFDHVQRKPTDVVIVDVTLPDEQGYWLVRQIGAQLPTVALAMAGGDGPDRTLAAGFRAHLRKPVDPWELCRVVAGVARKA